MALVNSSQLQTMVDMFVDKVIEEIRPVEDRRERNRYLMEFRRRLYFNIYKKIDSKLSGPGRGTGESAEEEEIRELWNNHPLIPMRMIADMYALSVEGCRARLASMKKRGLEVLGGEERMRRQVEMKRQRKALDPRVKQAKKPRVFECTNCTFRHVEYMTGQQWENWNAQKEIAACKKCQKVGTVIAW